MFNLPTTRSSDSVTKQIGVYLINWIFWYVEAFFDGISTDIGQDYGATNALFVATIPGVAFGLWLFSHSTPVTGVEGWVCLTAGIAVYLLVGILYHLWRHNWGHYIKSPY